MKRALVGAIGVIACVGLAAPFASAAAQPLNQKTADKLNASVAAIIGSSYMLTPPVAGDPNTNGKVQNALHYLSIDYTMADGTGEVAVTVTKLKTAKSATTAARADVQQKMKGTPGVVFTPVAGVTGALSSPGGSFPIPGGNGDIQTVGPELIFAKGLYEVDIFAPTTVLVQSLSSAVNKTLGLKG